MVMYSATALKTKFYHELNFFQVVRRKYRHLQVYKYMFSKIKLYEKDKYARTKHTFDTQMTS